MAHVKDRREAAHLRTSANPGYEAKLKAFVKEKGLENRVTLEFGWITEERKAELMNTCLASAYAPHDEDSYGYPTLEAASARKPTVTASDSGGTLEFIETGRTASSPSQRRRLLRAPSTSSIRPSGNRTPGRGRP